MVTDCSGLLRWALAKLGESIVHHARYQYTDYCNAKGKLVNGKRDDGKAVLPGTAVFLQGTQDKIHHVGVYVGNDTCIEAKGTIYGVVVSNLAHWDHWGELKMVDYEDAAVLESGDPSQFAPGGTDDATAGTILCAEVCNPQTWLNVRSGPGSSYPVVYQVQKGSIVELLDAGEPEWWQIRYGGRIGWAFAKYLKPIDPPEQEPDENTPGVDEPTEGSGGDPVVDPDSNTPDYGKAVRDALDAAERAYNDAGEALARLRRLIEEGAE